MIKECEECKGEGYFSDEMGADFIPCEKCNSEGVIAKTKTYHVKMTFYDATAYSIIKVDANNEEEALMIAFDKTEEEYKDRMKKSKVIYVSE